MASSTLHSPALHEAYRLIAGHVYRGMGDFAYQAFDDINRRYFAGCLPEPLLLWDITSHGHNLGWTRACKDGPPIIKLHPSVLAGTESAIPWQIAPEVQGVCLAYDLLLHECVHLSVDYLHGGWENLPGLTQLWTSHNNPVWVDECNRIACLLGFNERTRMGYYKRVPVPGKFTKTGKSETKPKWTHGGRYNPEYFPQGLRGRFDFYLLNRLPFDLNLNGKVLSGSTERTQAVCAAYKQKEEVVLDAIGSNQVVVKRPGEHLLPGQIDYLCFVRTIPRMSEDTARCVFSSLRWQGRIEEVSKRVYEVAERNVMESCA